MSQEDKPFWDPESQPQAQPKSQPRPRRHSRKKRGSVVGYLLILFAAAFLLLLMAFLMQQRSNEIAMNNLQQTSSSALDTLDNILAERDALKEQAKELEQALDKAQENYRLLEESFQDSVETSTAIVCAMDWLREIQGQYSARNYRAARELIRAFEDNELPQYLPTGALHTGPDGNDATAPAAVYRDMVEALFPNGVE